jgi:uncharacterized delta-60 repeat protein
MLFGLLKNARRPSSNRPRRAAFRPRLELLEGRLCPSGGLLDPTFGSGGTEAVTLPSTLYNGQVAAAVQPDGKIVSVGMLIESNKARAISVVRMNPDGSLDTSFNGTGYVALKPPGPAYSAGGDTLALQPDGKIVVGGSFPTSSTNSGNTEFVVARLNTNGTLDKTFAKGGLFVWNATTGSDNVNALAVLADGSIAAAGGAGVFKLSASGALVSSFGKGGLATFQVGASPNVTDMAVAPNGDLILSGSDTDAAGASGGMLIAVNASTGRLDTNFNNGQGWVADFNPAGHGSTSFNAVAIQGNNIVVAGNANGTAYGVLARFTLAGALDTTFANGGVFVTATRTRFDNVAVESDGSLVVSGASNPGSGWEMAVGHFTADGQLDTTFGSAGTGFTLIPNGGDGYGLALGTDGSIVVCGGSSVWGETLYARLTGP